MFDLGRHVVWDRSKQWNETARDMYKKWEFESRTGPTWGEEVDVPAGGEQGWETRNQNQERRVTGWGKEGRGRPGRTAVGNTLSSARQRVSLRGF